MLRRDFNNREKYIDKLIKDTGERAYRNQAKKLGTPQSKR